MGTIERAEKKKRKEEGGKAKAKAEYGGRILVRLGTHMLNEQDECAGVRSNRMRDRIHAESGIAGRRRGFESERRRRRLRDET